MAIYFELRQGDANKDNTRTIRAYIYHNGKAYYTTKYSVLEKDWDARNCEVKKTRTNHSLINGELIRLRNELEALCINYPNLPATEIKKLVGKKNDKTLLGYFESFITNCENGTHKRSTGTIKRYKVVHRALAEFGGDFGTINKHWYDRYVGEMRNAGKNENTIGSHIKIIKLILRMAYEDGVTTNEEFRKKYFKKPSQPTDSIYLNKDDIKKLEKVDLPKDLEIERDRALISYYFLLRFTDSISFSKANFTKIGDSLFFKLDTQKTFQQVILPVKPSAIKILKKYDFKLKETSNQEANWKIREICIKAGIKEKVNCNGKTSEKYDFVSSHTFRRSGATQLYLDGMPIMNIMHLLGHKKISTTENYIRIDRLESAKKAQEFDFFK